jgi:elongator complex protein 1
VLAGIRKSIAAKDYRNAYLACRNQRVDMNILYDHAPNQFLANVVLFVEQVKRMDYIDLFLSGLKYTPCKPTILDFVHLTLL